MYKKKKGFSKKESAKLQKSTLFCWTITNQSKAKCLPCFQLFLILFSVSFPVIYQQIYCSIQTFMLVNYSLTSQFRGSIYWVSPGRVLGHGSQVQTPRGPGSGDPLFRYAYNLVILIQIFDRVPQLWQRAFSSAHAHSGYMYCYAQKDSGCKAGLNSVKMIIMYVRPCPVLLKASVIQ